MNQFDRDPGIVPEAPPVDAPPEPARPGPFHHGLVSRLRNYFLTGLILVAPAYITISLTWWFINWVDDLVRPFIPLAYLPETYLPVKIPGRRISSAASWSRSARTFSTACRWCGRSTTA